MIYGSSVETPLKSAGTPDFDVTSPNRSQDSNVSLKNELKDLNSPETGEGGAKAAGDNKPTSDKSQLTDSINVRESATGTSECGMLSTAYLLSSLSLSSFFITYRLYFYQTYCVGRRSVFMLLHSFVVQY